ncbi:30S ribosomal protein S19 [Candidatus Mycoplasma haematolamae str. Purdue]|uniref:Small ribosomal subunit protein uS19 n=1 Tax=Mycoplasma haematolamae (strain Purdue) TaxID=1212765 RepID=I7CJV3_MYCHA|nr:30S ribosomal protein S19 [Candidatus Mycoplasma haematolamae]AFO52154.1 30S ribosomal protein S19 [Candidatus Mycoplasma haematolamae str. Purdue]
MSRSSKKGLYVCPKLLDKAAKMQKQDKKKAIKTWSRNSAIYPEFLSLTFLVHNGRSFVTVKCNEYMLGHKLGEFAPTRVFKQHTLAKSGHKNKK